MRLADGVTIACAAMAKPVASARSSAPTAADYLELRATALASGANVLPRLGPAIVTR